MYSHVTRKIVHYRSISNNAYMVNRMLYIIIGRTRLAQPRPCMRVALVIRQHHSEIENDVCKMWTSTDDIWGCYCRVKSLCFQCEALRPSFLLRFHLKSLFGSYHTSLVGEKWPLTHSICTKRFSHASRDASLSMRVYMTFSPHYSHIHQKNTRHQPALAFNTRKRGHLLPNMWQWGISNPS